MAARLSSPSSSAFAVEQNAEINVTPFVDVMLVLLIIFMVAAPLATSAVKVDLPSTPPMDELKPTEPIVVTIAADGGVFVNDERSSMAALSSKVAYLITSGSHDDRVIIRADKTVDYEVFMDAVSTLNRGGVGKLALVSEIG